MSSKIIIVGGGTAGITMAAQLVKSGRDLSVILIEPSEIGCLKGRGMGV